MLLFSEVYNFDERKTKVNILFSLLIGPNEISLVETRFDYFGKLIDRRISTRTVIFFLILLIFLLVGLFLPFLKEIKVIVVLAPMVLTLIILGIKRFYINKFISEQKGNFKNVQSELDRQLQLPRLEQTKLFKRLSFFLFISPFNLRHVWLWALVIGMYGPLNEYIGKYSINFNPNNIDWEALNIITGRFLQTLIVSIIAYIATNIIRELLSLREYYVTGIAEVMNLAKKSKDYIEDSLTIVNGVGPLINLNKVAEKLISPNNKHYVGFIEKIEKFIKNMGEYTSSLSAKLHPEKINDNINKKDKLISDYSKIALTVSMVELLNNKINKLKNQTSILTSFTNLGSITAEILKNTSGIAGNGEYETEYFALQIKPLLKFINYPLFNGADKSEKKEWEKYITSCINHTKNKTNICRYFVSIPLYVLNDIKGKKIPEELKELSLEETNIEQLNYKIFNVNESLIGSDNIKDIEEIKDVIINYDTANPLIATETTDAANMSVLQILNNVIHIEGNCYIREFDQEDIYTLLLDISDFKRSSYKPLDYLAFRIKYPNDGTDKSDWVFCLESLYDKDLDIAQIRVFFEEGEFEFIESDQKVNEENMVKKEEKIVWKSCSTCDHKNFMNKQTCVQNCWETKKNLDPIDISNRKIINRKLKLNKLFFGNPFITKIYEAEEKTYATLVNNETVEVHYNGNGDSFPENGVLYLKKKISSISQIIKDN